MGVKGLFQFLKRFEKEVNVAQYVRQKSVGVDIFWFLHKSKGDMFMLQSLLIPIIRNAKETHCVFDGKPSQEKIEALKEQHEKRKVLLHAIAEIEDFLRYPFHRITSQDRSQLISYLHQLKRQAWTPSPDYIYSVKEWLLHKGCSIYQAVEEADDALIELEKQKKISVIVTNDSDLLILGSNAVLRLKTPTIGKLFEAKFITKKLNFTDKQWNEFMTLCKYMSEKDITLAYSIISVYKDLEYGLQKHYIYSKDELVKNSNFSTILPDID